MEARQTFRPSISKQLVAIVLVVVACGLAAMAAYAAINLGGSAAATSTQTVVAPATNLPQDNGRPLPIRHS